MVQKLIRRMLIAQIFSALTVSVCLLIDNVMISRFLGEEAITAYQLANPLLLLVGAVASILATGIQVACGKSLGKGSQEETNAGFSSAVAVALGISLPVLAIIYIFATPLTTMLGAGTEGSLFEETRGYLRGFNIGGPATMGALVLVPFLQMAGKSGLLVAAVLGMTVVDIGLDLLNALVLHWGMFGMGLASALSYYVAVIIGSVYFFLPGCPFRFSGKGVSGKKIRELFQGGVPNGFNMISSVVLVFAMNRILQSLDGKAAVAAYAVFSGIGNAANCIATGIGGVSLTLSGIFFHEEDRTSLKELLKILIRDSVLLGLGMGVLLLIFAPALVGLFIPEEGTTKSIAVLGLRLFAAGMIPCSINNAIKNAYQSLEREKLTELISVLEGAVLPALAALILSRFLGTTGALLFFVTGETLTLLFIGGLIRKKTGRQPWQGDAGLLLREDFGVTPDRLLEMDIHSLEEANDAAQRAEQFCLRHGQSARISNHIALCVEEMAVNTIEHGFRKDGKNHHLSVRLLRKADHWILRFRDDCGAFDPVHFEPGEEQVGIRMVMKLAEEAHYTYSLNLNNLMLRISGGESS